MPKKAAHDDVVRALRAFGLAYPGAHTKSPWPGHLDLAVNDKTFAYLGLEGEPLHVSCKLPASSSVASMLPFASPTGYGLGKSGWVSATFTFADEPPVALLEAWIDESYRAQAPKKLVKALDEGIASGKITGPRDDGPAPTKPRQNAAKSGPAKKTAANDAPKKGASAEKATAKKTAAKSASAEKATAKKTAAKKRKSPAG